MEPKTDLRIIKTYNALSTTFFQLLEKKCFEDITVKELCDQAMIRRATFYKHFADKYEFAIFIIRELQKAFYGENKTRCTEIRSKAFYIDVLQKSITFISQNEKLISSILQSNMRSSLLDILSEEISSNLKHKFEEDIRKGANLPANPELLAHFFTGSFTQTIRWWLGQKDRMSEEQLITQFVSIFDSF